jgi:hypothetical protein
MKVDVVDKEEGKKIKAKSVVDGKKHKQSALEMFKEAFVGSDGDDFKRFLIQEVIVPTIQEGIIDGVMSSLGMFMYGDKFEMGRGRRRGRRSRFDDDGYRYHDYRASYKRRSRFEDDDYDDDDRPRKKRRTGSLYKFDCVELEDEEEMDELVESMEDYIDTYDEISVAQMYQMANITPRAEDFNYGWNTMKGHRIVTRKHKDYDSYILDMPSPRPISD